MPIWNTTVKIIIHLLDKILELPLSYSMWQELTALLVEIKLSDVLRICSSGFKPITESSTDVYMHNLHNCVYPFHLLHKQLENSVGKQTQYVFSFVEDSEKEIIDKKLKELVTAVNAQKAQINDISEIHHNRIFLCVYALPVQYKLYNN